MYKGSYEGSEKCLVLSFKLPTSHFKLPLRAFVRGKSFGGLFLFLLVLVLSNAVLVLVLDGFGSAVLLMPYSALLLMPYCWRSSCCVAPIGAEEVMVE
jgi:hypothetical protein